MIAEGSLVTEFEKAMSKYLGLSGGSQHQVELMPCSLH